jgi:ribonuclease HI
VWLERNRKVFENGIPSTSTVVYKTLGMLTNWTTLHPRKEVIKNKVKKHIPEGMPTGWFDGAAQSNGLQSGAGGLISISKNSHYRWTFNCGPGTNTRAELLGVWATLHLATRLNIEVLQIFGDSIIVIDWLNSRGKLQVISLLGWKDRIRELQSTFRKINFNHTYREHNKEADLLSKAALQKQAGIITFNHWVDGHEGPPHILNLY